MLILFLLFNFLFFEIYVIIILEVSVLKYYFGIDVGGTYIKAGIIDEKCDILCTKKIKTTPDEPNFLANSIIKIINLLLEENKIKAKDVLGIGVGLPGLIDSKNGVLGFSGNLKLKNYPLKSELEKVFDIPIKIANDADIATLAEMHFGAGQKTDNFAMLTIGTGIGGGVVMGGRLISDHSDYAGEVGHMKITDKKIKCTCGEFGCFETLASTKALVRETKLAMKKHPESLMWQTYDLNTVTGKTVFEYISSDETARQVFDKFIKNLGDGIVNLVNIFKPELILLGGAVSSQRSKLTAPLEEYVNNHIYARHAGFKVKVKTATLANDAGILGCRCLFD